MIFQTTRFGKIEVAEEEIITMQNGPLGFSQARLYTLLDDEINSPFKWFQSLEEESLAFVTVDPQIVVSNYKIALTEEHMKKLKSSSIDELGVLVIVTMTKDVKDVTVNLQGPLVINYKTGMALQLVILDGEYSTRQPLFGDKLTYISQTSSKTVQQTMPEAQVAVG
ncbi:MAG: flagellar assembly protein FliW [SAR324 cluster bacterium]|nr:flagellar assembly protein FliW [SAR324 cluster bacterium]